MMLTTHFQSMKVKNEKLYLYPSYIPLLCGQKQLYIVNYMWKNLTENSMESL